MKKIRKISAVMALMMALTLAMPVLAFAAERIVFEYDVEKQTVTGAVYYDDLSQLPDTVIKAVYVQQSEGSEWINIFDDLTFSDWMEGEGGIGYLNVTGNVYGVTGAVYGFHLEDFEGTFFAGYEENVTDSVYRYVYSRLDDEDHEDDDDDGGSKSGSSSGGGGGGEYIVTQEGERLIYSSRLKADENGAIVIAVEEGDKKLLIPAHSTAISADHTFFFEGEDFIVEIPGEVMEQLQKLAEDDYELRNSYIVFSFEGYSQDDFEELLADYSDSDTELTAAGVAYKFGLSYMTRDREEQQVSSFDAPVSLQLKASSKSTLTGIYELGTELEYAGSTVKGDFYTASVDHFNTYGVVRYEKNFTDVPSSYWAYDIIREMAAKQVVFGRSSSLFAPSASVTRAEFTSLIVRALGISGSGSNPFKDVESNKWYTEDVLAAYHAGLVAGRSNDQFAPHENITREEMAVLLIKAYEWKTGEQVDLSQTPSYADTNNISSWAQPYVGAASALGMLKGQGNNMYGPKAFTTRAESAQVIGQIYN